MSNLRVRIVIDKISEFKGVQKVLIMNIENGKATYIDHRGAKIVEGFDDGGSLLDTLDGIVSALRADE